MKKVLALVSIAGIGAFAVPVVETKAQVQSQCVALAAQFDRAMKNEQLAIPDSRSRNPQESSAGSARVLAEQNRQAQALQLMRDHRCPMPKETDSRVYAIDAQECGLALLLRRENASAECDQTQWTHQLTLEMRRERGLP